MNLKFLKLHILQSYIDAQKHWGKDIKFVIISYTNPKQYLYYKPLFQELEDVYRIKVININNLSNKNFFHLEYHISKKDGHPNKRAWEEITPLIVKELGL